VQSCQANAPRIITAQTLVDWGAGVVCIDCGLHESDPETHLARFSQCHCDWTACVTVLMTKHLYEKGRGRAGIRKASGISALELLREHSLTVFCDYWWVGVISKNGPKRWDSVATSSQSGRDSGLI